MVGGACRRDSICQECGRRHTISLTLTSHRRTARWTLVRERQRGGDDDEHSAEIKSLAPPYVLPTIMQCWAAF